MEKEKCDLKLRDVQGKLDSTVSDGHQVQKSLEDFASEEKRQK